MLNNNDAIADLRHTLFHADFWKYTVLIISVNDILTIALNVDIDITDLFRRNSLNTVLEGGGGGNGFGRNRRITIKGLCDPCLDGSCYWLGMR